MSVYSKSRIVCVCVYFVYIGKYITRVYVHVIIPLVSGDPSGSVNWFRTGGSET